MADRMSTVAIHTEGDGLSYLAFPAVQLVVTPLPLRNVSCFAFLRLANGTVWFLKTIGQPWTEERIHEAGVVLANLGVPGCSQQRLEERMAWALEIPRIAILQPVLIGADAAQWDLRRTAVAMMARSIQNRSGALSANEFAVQVAALERDFQSELDAAVREFAIGLDREAIELATVAGHVDTSLYNYLTREPGRAWRMQFARTFPLFLRVAATGDDSSVGAGIRDAVETGLPMVKHLARIWAVNPGAIRSLIGRSPILVGTRWEADVRTLVRLLDRLRPEDRPDDDAEAWERLSNGVDTAERIFRCPIMASFLSVAWLREAARKQFQVSASIHHGRSLSTEVAAAIDALREHLINALAYMTTGQSGDVTGEPRVAAATVTDRYLAAMSLGRLADVATEYGRVHARLLGEFERESRLVTGEAYWPLMPTDFLTADGARRIVALTSREALMQQGIRMALCIRGGGELATRAAASAQARTFLVAIVDATSGTSESVAEFRLHRSFRGGKLDLQLVQHQGFRNSAPSIACVKALRELMAYARSSEIQEHWESGRRLVQQHTRSIPETIREAEHGLVVRALRTVIGATVFDAAASQVAKAGVR